MNKKFWRRQHKWFGLITCFFMLMFCISGITLNHRVMYSRVNVSRSLLPHYRYENWNAGLLRGTLPIDSANILIYGQGGIWRHDGRNVHDYNAGLPQYADYRIIRNIVRMPDSALYAAGQYELYRRAPEDDRWHKVTVSQTDIANQKVGYQERYSDIASKGDTLILLSRDRLLMSLPPYQNFVEVPLDVPSDYSGNVSLFRVFWLIHSAEMFGMPGRVILDIIGLVIILLCITGIVYWLFPKLLKRGVPCKQFMQKSIKINYKWHLRVGVWTFVVVAIVVFTGWCLRPPLLIPLAKCEVAGIPGTPVAKDKVWDDKLRAIRYDAQQNDWILSTSNGFYSIPADFTSAPAKIDGAPHVSVMGVNVLQQESNGDWLVGSLSGMWRWNRNTGSVVNYFTGETMPSKPGAPFGKTPVSGYSADFDKPLVAEYYKGTDVISQPHELETLPMSLWQLALEVHTGRIYHLFGLAPLIWIFIAGAALLWTLYSGWKLRPSKKKSADKPTDVKNDL